VAAQTVCLSQHLALSCLLAARCIMATICCYVAASRKVFCSNGYKSGNAFVGSIATVVYPIVAKASQKYNIAGMILLF
jgi:hypothetical protein